MSKITVKLIRRFDFVEQGIEVSAEFNRTDGPRHLSNGKIKRRKVIECILKIDGRTSIEESICRPGDQFDVNQGMLFAMKKAMQNHSQKPKLGIVANWLMVWHQHYKGLNKRRKKLAKEIPDHSLTEEPPEYIGLIDADIPS